MTPFQRAPPIFASPPCEAVSLPEGGFVIRSSLPAETYPAGVFEVLGARAREHPERVLYRESDHDGIVGELTFGEAYDLAQRAGKSFLALGATQERPIALVADNSIRAAIAILGCYGAGVPVAPISPAYSKLSTDFGKLRYVLDVLTPAAVIFDDGFAHARAIAAVSSWVTSSMSWGDTKLMAMRRAPAGILAWDEALAPVSGGKLDPGLQPDRVAKILFTSGSTGWPKGVINTQRMMMSNQQALAQVWPGLFDHPPRLVDWLPWNHTYGGNQLFNMPIVFGGSLTIDRGRPTPAGIATMIQSIKRTRPTLFLNVPRALDLLADHLDRDRGFAEAMFGQLELIGYAGAALPPPVSAKLIRIAREVKGREIPIVGLWGSTETAPVVTAVYFPSKDPANIGLPIPGISLKFAPDGTKHELRVKGPGVTPGYWRQPQATAKAFDSDGYYRMGDAGRLVDPQNVNAGILFDGRVAENFKLTSGTWVNVGALRVKIIAACIDLIADAVIAGHDRADVRALIFPKPDTVPVDTVPAHAADGVAAPSAYHTDAGILRALAVALAAYNRTAGGSSHRIVKAIVVREPPSIDAGEITDKGYINQRAVLERRSALVELLYADEACDGLIEVEAASASGVP
jgi:feruloyl-CoA synthase